MGKNIQSLTLLRNTSKLYADRATAVAALQNNEAQVQNDGVTVLARYQSGDTIKTVVGFYALGSAITGADSAISTMTVVDVEGSAADLNALREEIETKLGTGITTADTATAQLAALSGAVETEKTRAENAEKALSGSASDTSATTSVVGAKKYADEKIAALDVEEITSEGQAIVGVSETDGIISATVGDIAAAHVTVADGGSLYEATNVEGALAEIADKVNKNAVSSSDKTITVTTSDTATDIAVNIDGTTLTAATDGKISANLEVVKLTSDELSSLSDSANVKEAYKLIYGTDTAKTAIGETIRIYKDQTLSGASYSSSAQTLSLTYILANGSASTVDINMKSLISETEIGIGLGVSDGGVVSVKKDTTSEKVMTAADTEADVLTISDNGVKVANIQTAINYAATKATITAVTANGVNGTVTTSDSGIAIATTISGQNITAVPSDYASPLGDSGVTTADTVSNAFLKVEGNMKTYDEIVSAALNDLENNKADSTAVTAADEALDTKIESAITKHSKDITDERNRAIAAESTIANAVGLTTTSAWTSTTNYGGATTQANMQAIDAQLKSVSDKHVSGITINSKAVTVTNNVAPITISASTTAATAEHDEAIVVTTADDGTITLGLATIDCGTY